MNVFMMREILIFKYDNRKLPVKLISKLRQMSVKSEHHHYYVWIDLEMTGLDPDKDKILEISCIITNPELQPVHNGITRVIHQPDHVLSSMNKWCIEQHGKTGLTEACRISKVSLEKADKEVAEYIKTHSKGHKYLAGNSVYMDKIFLMKYMPCINNILHYRIIDVSTLKLLMNDWYPKEFSKLPKKNLSHRAQDDILESIEELKKYRNHFFK